MAITSRQFEQLTEMGITLWQSRTQNKTLPQKQKKVNYQEVDLTLLANDQCFTDVLLTLGLSIGEVKTHQNGINLGLFNWFFLTENGDKSKNTTSNVSYKDNQLVTPNMSLIAQSPELKKKLWHLLSNEVL
jgi:hypothetical protein